MNPETIDRAETPAAELLIEIDGVLVDPETGEQLTGIPSDYTEDGITSADVEDILQRIAAADGRNKAAADLYAAAAKRLTREHAKRVRCSEWLRRRSVHLLSAYLRRRLNGRGRSIAHVHGTVGLRRLAGGLRILDGDKAITFCESHAPHLIRTRIERYVLASDVKAAFAPENLPADVFEVTPARDVLYVDTIDGVKVPGIPVPTQAEAAHAADR